MDEAPNIESSAGLVATVEQPKSWAQQLVGTLKRAGAALGLNPRAAKALTSETANELALERTTLALERNYLASERTLMAWVRTALSMISFGFTIGKLGQALQEDRFSGLLGRGSFSINNMAYFLVIIGTFALLGANLQHHLRVHALREQGFPRQFSVAAPVALLLALVGGFAFTALALKL
jgi:putative membrane protein